MTKENLIVAICEELSNVANPSEAYLIAGSALEVAGVSGTVSKAVSEALDAAGGKPLDALTRAYNTVPVPMCSMFADGSVGHIEKDGVCVKFSVRKIRDAPDVYRVWFSRIDASRLLDDVNQQIEDLAARVHYLETGEMVPRHR